MIFQIVLCLLLSTTGALAQCGNTVGPHSCGVVTNPNECTSTNCCWKAGTCEALVSASSSSGGGGRRAGGVDSFTKYVRTLTGYKKPQTLDDWSPVSTVARNSNLENKEAGISQATSRGVKRNFFGSSPFGSSFGGQSSAFALIAGLKFPKCPVDVKICHRVPCGGAAGQNDWVSCLRSPLCCFDHQLNFYKRFLGQQYMRQSPVCYHGATSSQWQHVTRLIRPWNPWFTSVVVDVFKSIFNTALIDIGGKAVCAFSGITQSTQCGHTGLSEEGCNLKGCCYSATRNIRCVYASPEAQRNFGSREIYPELFTQDPSETQCSRNVFSLGPRAYSRLPCAGNTLPSNPLQLTLNYCPQQYCCLNYLALSDKFGDLAGLSQLSQGGLGGAFSGLGGLGNLGALGGLGNLGGFAPGRPGGFGAAGLGAFGGSPFGGAGGGAGGLSSLLTLSLLGGNNNSTGNSSLSKIFCPYYFVKLSSSFPDLTDSVSTCCTIPACYHKKQFLNRGGGGGPFRPQPPINNRGVFTNWSPWTNCDAQCGTLGQLSRSRRCTYGGNPSNIAPTNQCSGNPSESRQCQGQPCISRGRWSAWNQGQCSVTCGQGTARYFRQCLSQNGQQVNDCSGSSSEQRQCNQAPCVATFNWGPWRPGACSVQCGTGQATYTRQCLYRANQAVSANNCGGRSTDLRQCNAGTCQQTAIYGTGRASGSCSVTCGTGTQNYIKSCIYQNTGGQAPQSACSYLGSSIEQRTCQQPPCRAEIIYGQWAMYARCGATCGSNGVEVYYRQCYYDDGRRTRAPDNLCDSSKKVVACPKKACQTSGYNWAGWSNWSPCTNYNGQCSSRQELNCYQFNGVDYQMVPQQSLCTGNFPTRVRTRQCNYNECNTQG